MLATLRTSIGPWNRQPILWRGEDAVESSEALLRSDASTGDPVPQMKRERNRKWWILMLLNTVFVGAAVALYLAAWSKYTERNACLKATSTYSPVFEEVGVRLTDTQLNGSLWLGDNPSIWRELPGSNEANEAWVGFEHVKPIALTREQVVAMGKDPDMVAKFNDEYWGLGDDAYVGALDFFHQVHCLNVLRHEAFRYLNREGETVPQWDDIHWIHIQHCVGMMMEHLLCNADAGFLTYNWMEHESHPFPDMSVRKQCRDWRQLVDYRDTHAVNVSKYVEWTKPDGVAELEQPADWWEHRGQHDQAHYADGRVIENRAEDDVGLKSRLSRFPSYDSQRNYNDGF